MATAYKALPYGISNFRRIREENYYFVDKSSYIPVLEDAASFLFLIRPRRFGKSLFLSMLRYYYDIEEKDNFARLFDGLWIGQHPTQWQGKFQVLHLDFSQTGGDIETLDKNFDDYMIVQYRAFAEKYAAYYPAGYLEGLARYDTASAIMNYVHSAAQRQGCKLYLIVDEYDNFTNTVLNEQGEAIYHAMTHASGFYRDVFKKFKGNFDRILMLGVSPVTMHDVTSGYNIATSITMDGRFNQMLGFSETEVREMIRYYQSAGVLQADEDPLVAEMKPWYDGYCFSEDVVYTDPKMFNSDMVTYYVNHYIQHGCPPNEMLNRDIRAQYTPLNRLISLNSFDSSYKEFLLKIVNDGSVRSKLGTSFSINQLTDPSIFISLLFYYGMLTITGTYGAMQILSIPNKSSRLLYNDYEALRVEEEDVS